MLFTWKDYLKSNVGISFCRPNGNTQPITLKIGELHFSDFCVETVRTLSPRTSPPSLCVLAKVARSDICVIGVTILAMRSASPGELSGKLQVYVILSLKEIGFYEESTVCVDVVGFGLGC